MDLPKHTNRRTVLKTLGAGVAGGVILTGRAAAADLDIDMVGDAFRFDPRTASIDVSSENKTVEWTYVKNGAGPNPPHDVHIAESNSLDTVYVHSGEGNIKTVGTTYSVTFGKDGDDLSIVSDGGSGDGDDSKHGGSGTVTGVFSESSSYALDYVCSVHAESMFGHLTVNG